MTALYVIITILILLAIYSFIETKLLKTTYYTVESDRIPNGLDGKRIVLLSDLHNTTFGHDNSGLLDMIRNAEPDMIIIAGDLVNGRSSRNEFEYAYRFLERLVQFKVPVYYSFGNHEFRIEGAFNNEGLFREYLDKCTARTKVINNSHFDPEGTGIRIWGLTLPKEQFSMKVKLGLKEPVSHYLGAASQDRYNILIAHDPSYLKEYSEWGADLILSGHMHGGIIRLPFIGGLLSPRYSLFPKIDKGLYTSGNCTMIASGGIGWHNFPFRFLNRPEVVVVSLRKI